MRFSWCFGTRLGAARTLSTLVAAVALSACGAGGGSTDAVNSSDALKGGVPANGHEKSNHGKHMGQAGGVAPGDADGGAATEDHGNGKAKGPQAEAGSAATEDHGNGKAKGPKAEAGSAATEDHGNGKAKGPKGGAGGHGHGDGDDSSDEGGAGAGGDGDESADESS